MGMHGAVLAGDADLTAGPSPLEENFQRELHMPPASIDSHLVMVSGMRKAYVSQNESFVTSFDGTVSWLVLNTQCEQLEKSDGCHKICVLLHNATCELEKKDTMVNYSNSFNND